MSVSSVPGFWPGNRGWCWALLGKLSDLHGRNLVFESTLGLLIFGSVLCRLAQSMGQLIAFRAIQGLGGGAIQALAFAMLGDILPPRERGKYIGLLHAQELGPQSALDALQRGLRHPMPYSMIGVPDGRGIRVGFLSQRVLRNPTNVALFPPDLLLVQASDDPPGPTPMNQIARPALQVTVRADNSDVAIISCRLKSKLLSFPTGTASCPPTRTSAPAASPAPSTVAPQKQPPCEPTSPTSSATAAIRR